jgi:squalene-hopene/tetraprenyl-beta-curcumene cyclase
MTRLLVRLLLLFVAFTPLTAVAAPPQMDPELKEKARRAVDAGLRYLRGTQQDDGSWGNSVGVTGLVLRAYLESHRGYNESDGAFITRPVQYLLYNVKPNGSITESLTNENYNTAAAMFALADTNNPQYQDIITNAQKYLKNLQIDESEGYERSHRYYGGIGYGGDERPDLANLGYALEALKKSGFDAKDPLWERAIIFVNRTQNRSESNDQKGAGNDGGFTYMPGYSPHGGTGSYGGMTSAGLSSLLLAGVDKADPRVQAAWKWIGENYTLDENPGAGGAHGLYFYYAAFAQAMAAMGEPEIVDKQGQKHNWRDELAKKLISEQQSDGYWVNSKSTRWWEGNKDLSTARAVIALNLAAK